MSSSKDLSAEIEQLDARRATLAGDLEDARHTLDASREGLVRGSTDVAGVTAAQSTFNALHEALAGLDGRITQRRADLEAAERGEKRTADLARACSIEKERADLTRELQSLCEQGNQALSSIVSAYMKKANQFGALGSEAMAITNRLNGTDKGQVQYSTSKDLQLQPVEPYGHAVIVAISIEMERVRRDYLKALSREQTKKRQALELARETN
jgi:hypothetical protein